MFNSKILAPENFYFQGNLGTPKANILLLLLNNIYLNKLDKFMEKLQKRYLKGSEPTPNEKFYRQIKLSKYEKTLSFYLQNAISRSRKKKLFNKKVKPYLHDSNFIRVKYIRYIDSVLIGLRGSKQVGEKIKKELQN